MGGEEKGEKRRKSSQSEKRAGTQSPNLPGKRAISQQAYLPQAGNEFPLARRMQAVFWVGSPKALNT